MREKEREWRDRKRKLEGRRAGMYFYSLPYTINDRGQREREREREVKYSRVEREIGDARETEETKRERDRKRKMRKKERKWRDRKRKLEGRRAGMYFYSLSYTLEDRGDGRR